MSSSNAAASTSMFFVAAVLATCSGAQGEEDSASSAAAATASPYPQSTVITGISWDFAHEVNLASGSDLWPTTWGADDNVWTGWGDGGGFGGGNSVDRVSVGFAKVTGLPPNITGTNVWGNTSAGAGRAQHQATFCGKPESAVSANGVLYVWIGSSFNDSAADNPRCPANPPVESHHLAVSSDDGVTWKEQSWALTENNGAYIFNNFVNFGKDNAGAPNGDVYVYGYKIGDSNTYLARVAPNEVTNLSAYRVFTGTDSAGAATWTTAYTPTEGKSVTKPTLGLGATFYHIASKRYISANFTTGVGSLVMLDAPEPWGPWSTFETETDWGGFGNTGESLALTFPTKWISTDGKTIWGVFSWGSAAGDAFHMLKATLTFGGGTTSGGAGSIVSGVGGRCLDDASDLTANGNKIQLYTCNGGAAQHWTYTNGKIVGPGGKCLDVQSDNQVKGTTVQLYQCNGTTAQTWAVDGKQIKSTSGLCLDVRSSVNANGTQIQVYTCNGTAAQDWTFDK